MIEDIRYLVEKNAQVLKSLTYTGTITHRTFEVYESEVKHLQIKINNQWQNVRTEEILMCDPEKIDKDIEKAKESGYQYNPTRRIK